MIRQITLLTCCACVIGCDGFGPGYTDFHVELGHNCQLIQMSGSIVNITVDGSLSEEDCVPAKVVSCGFGQKYIIAKQQLLDEKYNPVSGKYQFWIVDAPQKKRYGPFAEKEFSAKRKELGVPESIKMRSTDSYRP